MASTISLSTGFLVHAFCGHRGDGKQRLLAIGGTRRTLIVLDLDTRKVIRQLRGHSDDVTSVCSISVGGRPFLASASLDRTVRLWPMDGGEGEMTIPVYHPAVSCLESVGRLVVTVTAGVIVIEFGEEVTSIVNRRFLGGA